MFKRVKQSQLNPVLFTRAMIRGYIDEYNEQIKKLEEWDKKDEGIQKPLDYVYECGRADELKRILETLMGETININEYIEIGENE